MGTNQGLYYFGADISYTDRWTFPLSHNYSGTPLQPAGDKGNAYYKNQTIKLKVGIQPNENHEYSLNYINQKGKKGGIYDSYASLSRGVWDWPYYDKDTVYLLGNSYFTPDLSLNTRIYYDTFYNQLNMRGCYNADGSTATTGGGMCSMNGDSIYDDNTYGTILTLGYDISENSNVKIGTNLKRDKHFEKNENDVKQVEVSELTTSIFAQYAQRLGSFRFIIAGSYDRLDTFDAYVLGQNNTFSSDKTKIKGDFSLQGILYYDISEGQSTHFSVGKKENMPSLKDRYSSKWGDYATNPDLQPESAINYELGYNLQLANTALSAAVFYNDMTNMFYESLVYENRCSNYANTGGTGRNPKPAGACFQNTNIDKGYSYGAELGVEQGLLENNALVVGANYSYIQRKAEGPAVSAAGAKKILDYPNHMFNAKVAIKPSAKLEFIGLSTFESARYYVQGTEYEKNNNYFTLDLSANYELEKGFIISAGVLNFTDRDNYINYKSAANHLAGRRYVVGFDYTY